MTRKILFVDDEVSVLEGCSRLLRRRFELDTAVGGEEALRRLAWDGPYAVLVTDMRMPSMDGLQLLTRVKAQSPDTIRMMLTGNADQQTAIDAVNQGAIFRFLSKPCPPEVLIASLEAALEQYRLVTAERELLEVTLRGSMDMLIELMGFVDADSFSAAQPIAELAEAVSRHLGHETPWVHGMAGALSQIGALTMPHDLLHKMRHNSFLTSEERNLASRLPEIGANLLGHIPRLSPVAESIRYMQKNFNGTGFPQDEVRGGNIPLGGRILRVVADFQALLSTKGDPLATVQDMAFRTTWYDMEVVQALEQVLKARYSPRPPVILDVTARLARVGMVLMENLETLDGLLIAPAHTRLGPGHIERLRNFASVGNLKEPFKVRQH